MPFGVETPISSSVTWAKRTEDFIIGLCGSTVFFLTYPFFALLIRLDTRGPVLYRQERVGRNKRRLVDTTILMGSRHCQRKQDIGGKRFTLYKYRTMRIDAEANGPQLWEGGGDSRVTRVGKWLRLFHLDELPQFLNILKGDMSFIGPRPERPHFTTQYSKQIPYYSARTHFVKPGLTGLAQIKLGYDDDMDSVVRKSYYDLSYIASFSSLKSWVKMELWVLCNTFVYLVRNTDTKTYTRTLQTLDRVKNLPFVSHTRSKTRRMVSTALVTYEDDARSTVLRGVSPDELGDKLGGLDFTKKKKFEVSLAPEDQIDMEDMVFIINLVRRVASMGGRLSIKNPTSKVRKMLKEMKFDNIVDIRTIRSWVRNTLTIDVECWFHAYNLKEKVPKATWHLQESRIISNVQRLLDLLKAHNTTATFFVLGWVADTFPEVVRMIDAGGHEIGTHGYYHNLAYDMTPTEFEHDLDKSLNAISAWTTQRVQSHRASNFSIIHPSLWALEILSKYGIRNDSSIFPIKRKRYGIPDYPHRGPHTIHFEKEQPLAEFPMATVKINNKLFPIAGGGYFRLYPFRVTAQYISQMNRNGIPVMVYVHPWELDTQQERIDVALPKRFQHYVNLETTYWKLSGLLDRFEFASIRDNLKIPRIQNMLKRNALRVFGEVDSHMQLASYFLEKQAPVKKAG